MLIQFSGKKPKKKKPLVKKRGRGINPNRIIKKRSSAVNSRTPKSARWKVSATRRRIVFLSIVIVILIVIAALLLLPGFFRIQRYSLSGNKLVSVKEVEQILESHLSGRYLWVIPKNNIWIISEAKINEILLSELSVLDKVSIEKQLLSTLKIIIEEKEPAFVWSTAGRFYYGDLNGVLFREIIYGEINALELPIVRDLESKPAQPKEFVITPTAIDFIEDIGEELEKKLDLRVLSWSMPGRLSPDLTAFTSEGWQILLDPNSNPTTQIQTLSTILSEEVGNKRKSLKYIDLRIENWASYN